MKIEVPYELGDPIITIEFNQHDGYYIEYKGFSYSDLSRMEYIFSTYKEAKDFIKSKETKNTKLG